MAVIRNKLNQRLIVNLKEDKYIDLFAKDTAEISDDDLSSPHLQALLAKGEIILSQKEEEKEEPKKTSYIKKGK